MCFSIKIMYVAFTSNRDYEAARRILKVAREELQKLAWQTTSAAQYLKDFMTSEEWDEQDADYSHNNIWHLLVPRPTFPFDFFLC